MSRIRLTNLKIFIGPIQELRLISLDPQLYTPEVVLNDVAFRVTDESGQCLTFRSQLEAKKPFKGLGIKRTVVVHQSSYDEMIGQAVGSTNLAVIPVCSPDDDFS